ncbi:hybrid sensor histidine kinase/response regulator [Polyangium aurulentum]|uniref:hybrid sensor histidine kinase/response regulator n=1 Tax=Polyangium aurulentum TaxID=2567896 RepID=UPI0010AE8471|nr:response regulator [Polyangium aurulentum]UQA60742.1 response regulator [Polyangium aurulentum]
MKELEEFFRAEARELVDGLTRDLLALERTPDDISTLNRCLRLAHTLKGAARVVRQMRVGEMAHTIEDALTPFRDGEEQISSEYVSDLLRILERIRETLVELGIEPGPEGAEAREDGSGRPASGDERLETVRIDIADMDALLEGLSEAAIQLGPLETGVDAVRHAQRLAGSLRETLEESSGRMQDRALLARLRTVVDEMVATLGHAERDMGAGLGRIERELGEVQARASTLRLVPVGAILGALELSARDAADALGKMATFEASGGDVRLEGHILSAVREALLHVIRNAVDHGVEPVEERIAQGKPAAGKVRLEIVRRGRRVAFRCRDDGRGIDVDRVLRAAVDRGLVDPRAAESLDRDKALGLVVLAGVSTSEEVTEISGRGVGLDVVREVAERLKGELRISSELGEGTLIELEVPVSLSSMPVLSVLLGGTTVLVPLDAVRGTRRVLVGEVLTSPDGERILFGDRAVPFVPLGPLLGVTARDEERASWSAVIVQAGGQWTALGVDRLLGTMEIVVKPLPKGAGAPPGIAGAAFDAQGDPILVLDPATLSSGVRGALRKDVASTPAKRPRLPILVIDDSLTTRMLEQSILESAGYEVDLCASGEEGLRKARTRRYGLFIVDVEMPGMNGFEFTAASRADAALRDVPVIIVTSLASPRDRDRGREAGASAYIVKGEFDQNNFVGKVAELLGGP